MNKSFKICAISDTHSKHNRIVIPECDILIHAGDATMAGEPHELKNFAKWLNDQEAGHIVFCPGNHELWLEKNLEEGLRILKENCPAINVLIHEGVEIEGIKIWGSPATPWFFSWSWNYARHKEEAMFRNIPEISTIWDKMPEHVDILVTHGPPYKVLDSLETGEHVGDFNLMAKIVDVNPDLHFFGHIHHSHGHERHENTDFYNVAICDEAYCTTNPVTVVDFIFE